MPSASGIGGGGGGFSNELDSSSFSYKRSINMQVELHDLSMEAATFSKSLAAVQNLFLSVGWWCVW